MRTRRLQVLFLLSLLGVLVILGLLAWALLGPVGGTAYAVVVLGLVAAGAWRARAAEAPAPQVAGRTCTCCTSTVHDPVEVRP